MQSKTSRLRPAWGTTLRRALLLGGGLLIASVVHAANTGTLSGVVQDGDGHTVAGVTVQITSDALIGGPQVALSGEHGDFAFYLLPVGRYTVGAELAGHLPTAAADVPVRSNRVASIAFELVPETFNGEIQVTADVPVVDTSRVSSGVVLDEQYLSRALVGTEGRAYDQLLAHLPGVTAAPVFGDQLSVFGSTKGENAYLVDGMNTSDTYGGTWTIHFNIDAVTELDLQTGGFEAEFGQATGGILNLITKSGGNRFSGTFDARYRGESFTEAGEHYDPDERRESHQQYAATLGGPVVRDRLWFFVSAQLIDTVTRGFETHFSREWKGWQTLAKGSWQIAPSTRGVLKLSSNPVEITGANMDQDVLSSAMSTVEEGGDLYQLEISSVLSEAWLLEGQVGTISPYWRVHPTSQPDSVSGHHNDDSGAYYHSSGWLSNGPQRRDEARAAATHFVSDLLGPHELKAGLGYTLISHEWADYQTGGGFITDHSPRADAGWDPVDLNGDGYFNHSVQIIEPEDRARDAVRSEGDLMSAFLQDAWRPVPNLTVKPGLRFDRVTLDNAAGQRVADMALWQPRLGVAWDVFGTARHVVRVSAGRFMDPTTLFIPSFASGTEGLVTRQYNTLEYYCNSTAGAICSLDDVPSSWEPWRWTSGEGLEYVLLLNEDVAQSPSSARTVDQLGVGRLRAPYSDQLILAYETRLAAETSLELSYVDKTTSDLIEDTCAGNEWAWGAAPPPSFDDPSTWTRDDECSSEPWVIVNMPGLERNYEAWILRFEARRDWGHLLASYTHADNRWDTLSGPGDYAWSDADYFPADFYNRYGRMGSPSRLQLNGFVLLPKRFTVAANGFWAAPQHLGVASWCSYVLTADNYRSTTDQWAEIGADPAILDYCRTAEGLPVRYGWVFLEEWDTSEGSSTWQLDLQVTKGFRIGGVEAQAMLTVYNLFGTEQVTAVNYWALDREIDEDGDEIRYQANDPSLPYYDEYYGADSSPVLVPMGAPTGYQRPRRYEIGIRIEF